MIDRLILLLKSARLYLFGACRQQEQVEESRDRVATRQSQLLRQAIENNRRMTVILDGLLRDMQKNGGPRQ